MSSCADRRAPLAVRDGRLVASGRVAGALDPRPAALHIRPPATPLARSLALAHLIEDHLEAGRIQSASAAAAWLGMTSARLSQLLRLRDLAPAVQEAVLSGRPLPARQARAAAAQVAWTEQRRRLDRVDPNRLYPNEQ